MTPLLVGTDAHVHLMKLDRKVQNQSWSLVEAIHTP